MIENVTGVLYKEMLMLKELDKEKGFRRHTGSLCVPHPFSGFSKFRTASDKSFW